LHGWKKPWFLKKKPQPILCFLFYYIYLHKREILGFFSSFKNTFRCIQNLNYNHSY
jgi:hypothetical protein